MLVCRLFPGSSKLAIVRCAYVATPSSPNSILTIQMPGLSILNQDLWLPNLDVWFRKLPVVRKEGQICSGHRGTVNRFLSQDTDIIAASPCQCDNLFKRGEMRPFNAKIFNGKPGGFRNNTCNSRLTISRKLHPFRLVVGAGNILTK